MKIKGKEQKFSKILEADNEKFALHKFYSIMGNAHGLSRRHITVEEIKTI